MHGVMGSKFCGGIGGTTSPPGGRGAQGKPGVQNLGVKHLRSVRGWVAPWGVEVVLSADLGALLSPVARLQLDHALRYA